MKTQTFGIYTCETAWHLYTIFPGLASVVSEPASVADYRAKRENGTDSDNPDTKFPQDGKITWIKGTVKDDGYVYGVKENDGYYHYEVRYDEGEGDKKWMEEKDKRYLARLEKEGKFEKEEPEEFEKKRNRKLGEKKLKTEEPEKNKKEVKESEQPNQNLITKFNLLAQPKLPKTELNTTVPKEEKNDDQDTKFGND